MFDLWRERQPTHERTRYLTISREISPALFIGRLFLVRTVAQRSRTLERADDPPIFWARRSSSKSTLARSSHGLHERPTRSMRGAGSMHGTTSAAGPEEHSTYSTLPDWEPQAEFKSRLSPVQVSARLHFRQLATTRRSKAALVALPRQLFPPPPPLNTASLSERARCARSPWS